MIKKIFRTAAIAGALFIGAACNNAEYNDIETHAFLNESTNTFGIAGQKVSYALTAFDYNLTPVLSSKLEVDAKFKLVLDEAILQRYNSEQGSNYELLDPEMYEFGDPVTIPAGSYSGDALSIKIKARSDDYTPGTYAVPVRLECVSGGVEVSSTSSAFVPAFEVLKTYLNLPCFTGRTGLANSEFGQSLTQFTVEARFQVSNTGNRNRDVFSNGKGVLLRFEDPQNDDDKFKAHSLVQFQGQGWYLNPSKAFEPNKWQHLALTYDGTEVTLYVNGENAGKKAGSIDPAFDVVGWFGGDMETEGGHGVGDTQWWSGCKIIPNEARVWSTCRTETQIKNNMTGVSASSEGLVGYWSFEKSTYSEENGFEDLTGNGHNVNTTRSFTWIENILVEDDSVAWPE